MCPSEIPHTVRIQTALEQRVLQGLACEWEKALWVLEPRLSQRMRKPLFRIGQMQHRWGSWSSSRREICISHQLVFHHPWDAVCEVLLHEIAHQLADEVLKADQELPHGPTFHHACYLLRANPRASGRYPTLHERYAHDAVSCEEDRIMRRIEKLMALSQSQNRHEAEAAMVKAHEMIRKYNLSILERKTQRDFISIHLGRPALRHLRPDYALARLLVDFYFVEGVWVSSYVMEKGKMGRVLEITGTAANVRIAAYVHDFIRQAIDARWELHPDHQRLNRHGKSDFAWGVIEGFYAKLKDEKPQKPETAEVFWLLKTGDPQLADYLAYRHPHTRSVRRTVRRRDETVFHDGLRVGQKLIISKAITTTEKSSRRIAYDGNEI